MNKKALHIIGIIYCISFGSYHLVLALRLNVVVKVFFNVGFFIPWVILTLNILSVLNLYKLKVKQFIIFGEFATFLILLMISLTNLFLTSYYSLDPDMYYYSVFESYLSPELYSFVSSELYSQFYSIWSIFIVIFHNLIYIFIIIINKLRFTKEERIVILTILANATKFARLEIREISEKSKIDQDSVIKIIIKFLGKNEIDAEYFRHSRSIAFNQQANILIIDGLYSKYREINEFKN